MLSSIHPLGERARGNRYWVTATALVVGSTASGALVGAALGAVGQLALDLVVDSSVYDARVVTAVVLTLVAAAVDARRARLPSTRRQVDERWLDQYRGWIYGLGYGAQLGAGVVTIVTSTATYLAVALALLTASVPGGAAVMGTFGLVRGASALASRRVHEPPHLMALTRSVAERAAVVRVATVVGLVALAAGSSLGLVV
jgi:hypothetical protein